MHLKRSFKSIAKFEFSILSRPSGNHGHPLLDIAEGDVSRGISDNHALRACIKNKVFDRFKAKL